MTKLTTLKTVISYQANDGMLFTSEDICLAYEYILTLPIVYIVEAPHHRTETLAQAIFLTEEEAEAWIFAYVNNQEEPYGGLSVMKVHVGAATPTKEFRLRLLQKALKFV